MTEISGEDMTTYAQTPQKIFWDIVEGVHVALRPIEDARAYVDGMMRVGQLKAQLSEMDYYTNKYVEGLLTEERWTEIKALRADLRAQINEIEESLGITPTENQ